MAPPTCEDERYNDCAFFQDILKSGDIFDVRPLNVRKTKQWKAARDRYLAYERECKIHETAMAIVKGELTKWPRVRARMNPPKTHEFWVEVANRVYPGHSGFYACTRLNRVRDGKDTI